MTSAFSDIFNKMNEDDFVEPTRLSRSVVQKEKSQWMLKMSEYSEDLLKGLDDTNFAERVKLGQINWIGKSTGVEVDVDIVGGGKNLNEASRIIYKEIKGVVFAFIFSLFVLKYIKLFF